MFRNQYDSDVTVWSPQGRLLQVEYAMEAVKQGSATVGLKSNRAVVLVALKRAQNELCSYQPKIFSIDGRIGVSVSGLMADARLLVKFLEDNALDYRLLHNEVIPVTELTRSLETKLQLNTQLYGRRPFGIGMLLVGYDHNGPYLIQTCPSGHIYKCKAMAIGARSQSAKTYIESNLSDLQSCDTAQLIKHALTALKSTLPPDMKLNPRNTQIGVIEIGGNFKVYDDLETEPFLQQITAAVEA